MTTMTTILLAVLSLTVGVAAALPSYLRALAERRRHRAHWNAVIRQLCASISELPAVRDQVRSSVWDQARRHR